MGIARKTICCGRLKNSISGNMDDLVSFARSIQVFGPSVLNSWHGTAFFAKQIWCAFIFAFLR